MLYFSFKRGKMNISQDKLKKVITTRYSIALILIAFLASIGFFSLKNALSVSQSKGYIINISGKQRMLSQQIALDVHKIYYFTLKDRNDKKNYWRVAKRLQNSINEMREANKMLSSGDFKFKQVVLSKEIYNLYYGDKNVAQRVYDYTDLANRVLINEPVKNKQKIVESVSHQSKELLKDLDTIVGVYQKESESDLEFVQNLERFVWIATLFLLILEILFIFQPMANYILTLTKDKNSILENLQHLVEVRTMHLEKANKKLNSLAYHDPLTGLYNRLSLEDDIDKLIFHYNSHHIDFGIILIDIDWFKDVNDSLGHDFGDFVLKDLAKLFENSFRTEDKIYRAGGEEFVVLLNRISLSDLVLVANHCRESVKKHKFTKDETTIYKSISIGVYHTSLGGNIDFKAIMKKADLALYRAKNSGRDRVEVFNRDDNYDDAQDSIDTVFITFKNDKFLDIDGVSSNIKNILGYSDKEIRELNSIKDIIHSDDYDIFDTFKDIPFTTLRVYNKDGKIIIVKVCFSIEGEKIVLKIQDGKLLHKSVINKTILYNFNAMMENSEDFIYFKDINHIFTAASKTLVDVTSVNSKEEFIGKNDYDVFEKEYADEYYSLEKKLFRGNLDVAKDTQPFLTNDGVNGYIDNRKYPIKDEDGNIIGLFGIARVIAISDEVI
jgi:diguanylate cyclase (GGDEF)-like protein